MGTLSAQLAESEKTVRELEHQVEAANAQVYPALKSTPHYVLIISVLIS